jgi:hypothetical protein
VKERGEKKKNKNFEDKYSRRKLYRTLRREAEPCQQTD